MKLLPLYFCLAATIAAAGFVLMPTFPLGIPDEWVWPRHDLPASFGEVIDRFLWPLLAGVGLLLAVSKLGPTKHSSTANVFGRYLVLMLAGAFWFQCLQTAAPYHHRSLKPRWILYDHYASGYFHEAVYGEQSSAELLAGYEARMEEGEVLHVGTHPPGLFLLNQAALNLCEQSPGLTNTILATISEDASKNFRTLEAEFTRGERPALTDSQFAALQLVAWLTQLSVVLAAIPIATICTFHCGRRAAWRATSFWFCVPAVVVFFPKSDVLFPLTATATLALASFGIKPLEKLPKGLSLARLVVPGLLAGVVFWCGCLMSLAHLPVAVLLAVWCLMRAIRSGGASLWPDGVVGGSMVFSLVVLSVLFEAKTGCDLQRVWSLNLDNHAGFYAQYPRTRWKWLLANPLELFLAAGPPICLLALRGLLWPSSLSENDPPPRTMRRLVSSLFIVWVLLWLSGKNMGEAGRLWCFLMPWLLIAAASRLRNMKQRQYLAFLVLQMIFAVVVVARISGFAQIT